eukprot:scaffold58510_cov27-Attheya_sp.AAC.2
MEEEEEDNGQWTMDERKHMRRYATVTTKTRTPSITVGIVMDVTKINCNGFGTNPRRCSCPWDSCSSAGDDCSCRKAAGDGLMLHIPARQERPMAFGRSSVFIFSMDDVEYGIWNMDDGRSVHHDGTVIWIWGVVDFVSFGHDNQP